MNKSPSKNTFPVCRACLSFDIKIYTIGPKLEKVFEKLTNIKLSSQHGKPRTVCYICCSLLKRCLNFATMSQISEDVLAEMLLNNPMLTKESITSHKDKLKNNFYPTPIVTYSITPNKKNYKPVTVKTEVIDDQENNETSDLLLNKEQSTEPAMLEKEQNTEYDFHEDKKIQDKSDVGEQLIIVGNEIPTCEKEQSMVDLELVISNVAQDVENEQNVMESEQEIMENEQEITENEHDITENEQEIIDNEEFFDNEVVLKNKQHILNEHNILRKEQVSHQGADKKSLNKQITLKTKQSTANFEKEHKMDSLISKLTQELEDGLNALNNEALREDIRQDPETITSDECILILSDEDEEMPECTDQTILIEDDDDLNDMDDSGSRPVTSLTEPLVQFDKTKYYVCNICSKSYKKSCLLRTHMKSHNSKGKLKPQVWTVFNVKEKIYRCEICNDSFVHKSSLVIHCKTHTRSHDFICDVCEKSYACKASLRVHIASTIHRRNQRAAEARRKITLKIG